MKPNPIALVIDSDRPSRRLLRHVLETQNYKVWEADSGQNGIKESAVRSPDVIILELVLPDMDGLVVLKQLREWNTAAILVLSDRDGERDKVTALDWGANDYVVKPFNSAELLARLRVLQRFNPFESEGPLFIQGGLCVDTGRRLVTVGGRAIDLSPTELAIFYTLVKHSGKVVTCRHLLRCVWGTDSEAKLHDLHVYIANIRQKLGDGAERALIQTEGSRGYRLFCQTPDKDKLSTAQLSRLPQVA